MRRRHHTLPDACRIDDIPSQRAQSLILKHTSKLATLQPKRLFTSVRWRQGSCSESRRTRAPSEKHVSNRADAESEYAYFHPIGMHYSTFERISSGVSSFDAKWIPIVIRQMAPFFKDIQRFLHPR